MSKTIMTRARTSADSTTPSSSDRITRIPTGTPTTDAAISRVTEALLAAPFLILAIALEKAELTERLSHAIAKRAGTSVIKFTFMLSIGLGLASGVMHDAAATAIGIDSSGKIHLAYQIIKDPATKLAKLRYTSCQNPAFAK